MDQNDNFALMPRPVSALEKAEPGAKRVLADMVQDALAFARRRLHPQNARALPSYTRDDLQRWHQKGESHYDGRSVPKNFSEAVKWFGKAAEQGYAVAQNDLGCCYGKGNGAPQDYTEAAKWYRKSAEHGNAAAQRNLGACYANGRAVIDDPVDAYQWVKLAEEHGCEGAAKTVAAIKTLLSPVDFREAERRHDRLRASDALGAPRNIE